MDLSSVKAFSYVLNYLANASANLFKKGSNCHTGLYGKNRGQYVHRCTEAIQVGNVRNQEIPEHGL